MRGWERLQLRGPFVIVCNHQAALDLLGACGAGQGGSSAPLGAPGLHHDRSGESAPGLGQRYGVGMEQESFWDRAVLQGEEGQQEVMPQGGPGTGDNLKSFKSRRSKPHPGPILGYEGLINLCTAIIWPLQRAPLCSHHLSGLTELQKIFLIAAGLSNVGSLIPSTK